jgi:hypothetical protein
MAKDQPGGGRQGATRRGMYVYAWDLWEEGPGAVIGRLRDAGLNAVSLATAYHAGKFLRPHAPARKVWFPEDGTVYFRPDASRYGRMLPQAATILDEFDALAALETHAPDFHRTGWTVGLHNSRLGRLHPDLTCQSAFGDPLVNALCPSQPEVRAYLAALCADLGGHAAIDEIAIEAPGFQTYRHGHHHEFELIELTDSAETLLGTCFCDACKAAASAAGLNADGLARQARRDLEAFFADGAAPLVDPGTDPDWAALQAVRAATVTSLVAEVRAGLARDVGLAVIPTVQSPNSRCWREGSDLAGLAHAADRLEVPAYQCGPTAIAADMAEVRAVAGEGARIGFILRPTWPHVQGPDDLAACLQAATEAGAEAISFYNYGHMRLQSLNWISACR